MPGYDFAEIERRWRRRWQQEDYHRTDLSSADRKCYCLVMFPYPSGEKLHLGHWMAYAPADAWARFRRLRGFRVFQPIGFDSFGLPAENFAIKMGVHPRLHTEENILYIREQLQAIGAMHDWSVELATHRPDYYRWTQWLFLLLYRAGLAYRAEMPVNWCDSCRTVLANEQVHEGICERCGHPVERQLRTQWCFRITAYADRLLEGLERIDWPEETRKKQRYWIGRSEGAEVRFRVPAESVGGELPAPWERTADGGVELRVFTTRPDTLFGATYLVLAPEHPLLPALTAPDRAAAVQDYVRRTRLLSEVDRASGEREKTGVPLGAVAVNPASGERIPIWTADYVLASYGTGAIMAVPGHDQRDFDFAARFALPIRRVVLGPGQSREAPLAEAYDGDGELVNSGPYDGLPAAEGAARLTADLASRDLGRATVQYRLRDWLVSRQRYWGAPIPIVHCERCGLVPVPERDLPVRLPDEVDFLPRGLPPLATSESFMATSCPDCGGPARRDPDTMDTFVDSSWYFLRYASPHEDQAPFRRDAVDRWLPVDAYVGGADHAYGHLIFSRFVTKVLCDQGLLGFDEPFQRLVHQGMITLGGEKMAKSRGNVVNPEEYLRRYGTDTLRLYVMFGFAFEDGGDWTDQGIEAVHRYLQRVVRLVDAACEGRSPAGDAPADAPPLTAEEAEARGRDLLAATHQSIKGCTEDTERFHFNTAISRLMELTNALYAYVGRNSVGLGDARYGESLRALVLMISPFAPHLGEELWQRIGGRGHVFDEPWPAWRQEALRRSLVTVVVQINGKIRERMEVPADEQESALIARALAYGRIPEWIGQRTVRKTIVVPNKLVNIVVQP